MNPREAAIEFHRLDIEAALGVAASFARNFEDRATAEQFDEYLRVLDLLYGAA